MELVPIARDLRAHVNLIPLNPTEGGLSRGCAAQRAAARAGISRRRSYSAASTSRRAHPRRPQMAAACGQLAGAIATTATGLGLSARAGLDRLYDAVDASAFETVAIEPAPRRCRVRDRPFVLERRLGPHRRARRRGTRPPLVASHRRRRRGRCREFSNAGGGVYYVAIVAAVLPLILIFVLASIFAVSILSLLFQIARVALLLHPQSRSFTGAIWYC